MDEQPLGGNPPAPELTDKDNEEVSDQVHVSLGNTRVTLTDDGRTISWSGDDNKLHCPVCNQPFETSQLRELEFHVEEHISDVLTCPVCNIVMAKNMQEEFQTHVGVIIFYIICYLVNLINYLMT